VTGAKGENYRTAGLEMSAASIQSFSALTTRIIDCSYRFKWRIFEHTQDVEAYRNVARTASWKFHEITGNVLDAD
jgi:hypothetical protein